LCVSLFFRFHLKIKFAFNKLWKVKRDRNWKRIAQTLEEIKDKRNLTSFGKINRFFKNDEIRNVFHIRLNGNLIVLFCFRIKTHWRFEEWFSSGLLFHFLCVFGGGGLCSFFSLPWFPGALHFLQLHIIWHS